MSAKKCILCPIPGCDISIPQSKIETHNRQFGTKHVELLLTKTQELENQVAALLESTHTTTKNKRKRKANIVASQEEATTVAVPAAPRQIMELFDLRSDPTKPSSEDTQIGKVIFFKDKFFMGYKNGYVSVWNLESYREELSAMCLLEEDNGGGFLAYSEADDLFFSGPTPLDCAIQVIKMEEDCGNHLNDLNASDDITWMECYHGRLYVGHYNGCIDIWETKSQEFLGTVSEHNDKITCLLFSDDYWYSGSRDGTVRVWDIETNECLKVLREPKEYVEGLLIVNGNLYCGSYHSTVCIWDIKKGHKLKKILPMNHYVMGMTASDTHLYVALDDGELQKWDLKKNKLECVLLDYFNIDDSISFLSFSTDHNRLYAGFKTGKICVFDTITNESVLSCNIHFAKVLYLHEARNRLFIVYEDEMMIVRDL